MRTYMGCCSQDTTACLGVGTVLGRQRCTSEARFSRSAEVDQRFGSRSLVAGASFGGLAVRAFQLIAVNERRDCTINALVIVSHDAFVPDSVAPSALRLPPGVRQDPMGGWVVDHLIEGLRAACEIGLAWLRGCLG